MIGAPNARRAYPLLAVAASAVAAAVTVLAAPAQADPAVQQPSVRHIKVALVGYKLAPGTQANSGGGAVHPDAVPGHVTGPCGSADLYAGDRYYDFTASFNGEVGPPTIGNTVIETDATDSDQANWAIQSGRWTQHYTGRLSYLGTNPTHYQAEGWAVTANGWFCDIDVKTGGL
jgi:hypothetical protein